MKNIYLFFVKLALKLHNFSVNLVDRLAIKLEGGLHPKHRLTDYHAFFLSNIGKDDVVLDLGCGNGALTHDLAIKCKFVVGVDLNPVNIKYAKEKYPGKNIEYRLADVTKEDFNRKFDVIVLSNVIEHIGDRVEFLKSIGKLAPRILIRVPTITRDWMTLYKKELGVEWKSDPTHHTEYTVKSFREEMEAAGLKVKDISVQFGEIWSVVIV